MQLEDQRAKRKDAAKSEENSANDEGALAEDYEDVSDIETANVRLIAGTERSNSETRL